MDYALLAGTNQGVSQGMANQMSALGMQADMYGSQAAAGSGLFGSLIGAAGTIFAGPLGGMVGGAIFK